MKCNEAAGYFIRRPFLALANSSAKMTCETSIPRLIPSRDFGMLKGDW